MTAPRALGNYQKQLRDEALMEISAALKAVKEVVKRDKADPYVALTQVTLHLHEVTQLLNRMDSKE